MANQEQLNILKQGVDIWNKWRKSHPEKKPDLSGALLRDEYLRNINFSQTNLRGANLIGADFCGANLIRADLSKAQLREANLRKTNLLEANCQETDFMAASLVETNLRGANLTGCLIYGISAWNVQLAGAIQSGLIITAPDEPTITVESLDVAQFIYLLLYNRNIRQAIDTITSKVVLLLGRFTPERKQVLDTLRTELQKRDYIPVVFDFEKPTHQDLTETISTLAHMARFILVDLTDPSSAPHEMATIVPHCIVPIQPLLLNGKKEYAMFKDLRLRYHWVLPTHRYQNIPDLVTSIKKNIIESVEKKVKELDKMKKEK